MYWTTTISQAPGYQATLWLSGKLWDLILTFPTHKLLNFFDLSSPYIQPVLQVREPMGSSLDHGQPLLAHSYKEEITSHKDVI